MKKPLEYLNDWNDKHPELPKEMTTHTEKEVLAIMKSYAKYYQKKQLILNDVSNSKDSSEDTVCLDHVLIKMYDPKKDEYYCEICEPDR